MINRSYWFILVKNLICIPTSLLGSSREFRISIALNDFATMVMLSWALILSNGISNYRMSIIMSTLSIGALYP